MVPLLAVELSGVVVFDVVEELLAGVVVPFVLLELFGL
jgi:hypothetical protein